MSPDAWEAYEDTQTPRAYKGGALNTNDPLRVRLAQEYHSPSVQVRANLGFRCCRTVCTPRMHHG